MDKKMDVVIIAVGAFPVQEIQSLMKDDPVHINVREMVDRDAAEKLVMFYRKL